jgi:hypothetical protein
MSLGSNLSVNVVVKKGSNALKESSYYLTS